MTDCKHRVVVVDDDEDIRETLNELLTDQGYVVALAGNGSEALALLEGVDEPCMMLVDLTMPVMDGWELLRRLGQGQHAARFPIYVSTSSPERAPAGFPVLQKPVDVADLLQLVKRHCA